MNRREFLHASLLSAAASAAPQNSLAEYAAASTPQAQTPSHAERVDFGYAFAPPHRMTVARPEASEKTLLDLQPAYLTMSWSYEDLRNTPLAIFKTPRTAWRIKMTPLLDGKPFAKSSWKRGGNFLPMLENKYHAAAGTMQLEVIGGATAALMRVKIQNTDSLPHQFSLACEAEDGWVMHNPAWIEAEKNPDVLVACQGERPDRVLLFGLGAEKFPAGRSTMTMQWTVPAGETQSGWVVRPHVAYEQDVPQLRARDWTKEFDEAREEWRQLLNRAIAVQIPDDGVRNAFYACLSDLFIMREPLSQGYMGVLCGTEAYRSTNPFEPSLAAIALDQTGFHAEAGNGLRVHLDMQEPDGNWADPKGWAHHMWGASGMKAWASMEHFKLTGDRAYLESVFPRMAASSHWQQAQRQKSRLAQSNSNPGSYGLMPRGMGDCGLMNGSDYFGVFYAHNLLAVFADQLSVEAAEILGATEQLPELRQIHETALHDLRAALKAGAIHEETFAWIPDSAGNSGGSRWGALYALYPTRILEAQDPLLTGTLKKIEHSISPGGQPVHTGWMKDGAWVAITLDNVAEAHLALGHGDIAAAYLYSTLNHGTPLYTWCEERGLEPHAKKTSGDRQHLWTPVAVVRYLRDSLVMEQPDGLHLALASARTWLHQGGTVGVQDAPTHFGNVTYRIESNVEHGSIRAEITPPVREPLQTIVLHLRHPQHRKMQRVTINGTPTATFDANQELVRLPAGDKSPLSVEAFYN